MAAAPIVPTMTLPVRLSPMDAGITLTLFLSTYAPLSLPEVTMISIACQVGERPVAMLAVDAWPLTSPLKKSSLLFRSITAHPFETIALCVF